MYMQSLQNTEAVRFNHYLSAIFFLFHCSKLTSVTTNTKYLCVYVYIFILYIYI